MDEGVASPVGGGPRAGGRAGVGPLSSEEALGSWASCQRTLWCLSWGVTEAAVLPAIHAICPFTGSPVAPLPLAPQSNLHQAGVLGRRGIIRDVHNFGHH